MSDEDEANAEALHYAAHAPATPAVDISSEAVAKRVDEWRDTGLIGAAYLLEALAADRDRLASELITQVQAAQEARAAAEKSAIALENIASALRKNETKMQAEIDRLSKNQMPWGV